MTTHNFFRELLESDSFVSAETEPAQRLHGQFRDILCSGKCMADSRWTVERNTRLCRYTIKQSQTNVQAQLLACDAVHDRFKDRWKSGRFEPHKTADES